MAESTVRIGLVLPDVMGTYGDGGNSVVLRQRLRLRGFDAEIVAITLDDPVPSELDLYTLGGAEDYAQRLATKHLIRYPGLQQAISRGAPVLAICAAIQVLGHWYETSAGERVDGVGVLDLTTSPQPERTIGEVASTPLVGGLTQPLTGFENHRGGTVLGADARPLAAVTKGAGNRAGDGIDGAVQGSVVATYLHGCCLARNPELADLLLAKVVGPLAPLELPEVDAAAPGTPGGAPPRLGRPASMPEPTIGCKSGDQTQLSSISAPTAAPVRLIGPCHDVGESCCEGIRAAQAPRPSQRFSGSAAILDVLRSILAVLIPVVFDTPTDSPGQPIPERRGDATALDTGICVCGLETFVDQQQSQPALLRGRGAAVDKRQAAHVTACTPRAPGYRLAISNTTSPVERLRPHQRVQARDGLGALEMAAQIECRPRPRRDR